MTASSIELAVYFANLKGLLNIEDALHYVDPEKIPSFVRSIVFEEQASVKEYYGNLVALAWFDQGQEAGASVRRLYFGQEFCEHLIPTPGDVEQAYYFSCQMGWGFTYTTGYVTDTGLRRICDNLDRLQDIGAEGIEVVFNDWGVLRVLSRHYTAFEPVLGRLLTKQKRLARYTRDSHPPQVSGDGIDANIKDVFENQISALRETDLSNPVYRQELKQWGIRRADVDIAPQRISLPEGDTSIGYSCYYPWGYVAGGRNCLTAGTLDKRREFVVKDGPCPRPCQHINKSTCLPHYPEATVQRGNTVFIFHGEYSHDYLHGSLPMSRVVFEPYIPI